LKESLFRLNFKWRWAKSTAQEDAPGQKIRLPRIRTEFRQREIQAPNSRNELKAMFRRKKQEEQSTRTAVEANESTPIAEPNRIE